MKSERIYHCIFNTYENNSVLTDPEVVKFLYCKFEEIAKAKGFEIIACKVLEDHVRGLIRFNIRHRLDYIIRMLKGISSRDFFKKYRTNRLVYRKLWARSYFAREINKREDVERAIKYINEQIDSTGFDKRYKSIEEPTVSLSGLKQKKRGTDSFTVGIKA